MQFEILSILNENAMMTRGGQLSGVILVSGNLKLNKFYHRLFFAIVEFIVYY